MTCPTCTAVTNNHMSPITMTHITLNGQVANSVSVGGANFTAVPLVRGMLDQPLTTFRVPKKVHKAQAPAAVTVHASAAEEELQFISFLENSNDDLAKYSRAEFAELVESSGLTLSVGAAITLWRGVRQKQLQQQHSHAVQADTAVDVLLSFMRTSTLKKATGRKQIYLLQLQQWA
eukprot:8075-Heterococcus_DN1.PRE.1